MAMVVSRAEINANPALCKNPNSVLKFILVQNTNGTELRQIKKGIPEDHNDFDNIK
jgi:hypothetical protein